MKRFLVGIGLSVVQAVCVAGLYAQTAGTRPAFVVDAHGAVIRGDVSDKEIALVFTGDEFADGGTVIQRALSKHGVLASFFLTGNFYRNPAFAQLVQGLRKDGHYLGAHSDRHLLYADWSKRDSLLVTEEQFKSDLLTNYEHLAVYGIRAEDAPYFLPPYEWYNKRIAHWTNQLGLRLINMTPGTRSHADYTYPEMADRYVSSEVIYHSILAREAKDPHGLNGYILLIHIGTDPRRTDKFYHRLDELLAELKAKQYRFVTIVQLLGNDSGKE